MGEKKSAEWPTLGEEVARKDTSAEENNNSVWSNKDKIENPVKSMQDIEATEKSSKDTEQQPTKSTSSTSVSQKPRSENLSNERKRVNSKPKWSRFEEDYKSSSSQKRRTDRDRYDDRPIRRGTGTGSSSTAPSTSSSSRYNSIRSSRSSQVSSAKSAVNRGRRENGYYSSTASQKSSSAQTNGDYKDSKSTAKQLTGRPVVIDPSHFYGTYYFSNPLDVAVGTLKESIKRQM